VSSFGIYLSLIFLISSACKQQAEGPGIQLNVEAKNASKEFSMSVLPNELGKFELKHKFVGIIPRKLAESSQAQDIELYVIEAPTIKFEEFNEEYIKRQKLPPRRISGLADLGKELTGLGLGFEGFGVAARKIDVETKNGHLTVKDLETKTSMGCDCPCHVDFDDGTKISCGK
jgi:hypothetical protein